MGALIFGCIGVYAGTLIDSSAVSYSPEDENWNVSNVETALDELFEEVFPECEYEEGKNWSFDYTGLYQEFKVPCNGTYKLEVWGAEGGAVGSNASGKGGYALGNAKLIKDSNIYIYVGQKGGDASASYSNSNTPASASFNGGGQGGAKYGDNFCGAGGGGATHISKTNTLLKNTNVNDLYIVAGAGGGGAQGGAGGYGGGLEGANGSYSGTAGGTQSTGYAYGQGGNGLSGSSSTVAYGCGGGGGGYYGGYGASYYSSFHNCSGGAGGSSYISGVTDGTTIAGNASMPTYNGASTMTGNSGHGYAKITLISIK